MRRRTVDAVTLRFYTSDEAGIDGYPLEWHRSIKHLVREEAGHRCVRCAHPYPPDIAKRFPRGEWSPCDDSCDHDGPVSFFDYSCSECDGQGWTVVPEHAEGCFGNCARNGCPVPSQAQCDECGGAGQWEIVAARWRILTVHHLDGNKLNCRWWNLAALCQRCHLQIQGKVKMHQTYPFEHSDWFKPHAAGYYALVYLGEELTREETVARLDDLLALECVGSGHW